MKKGLSGLYLFKDDDNTIIYIGKADDIHARLMQHKHLPIDCYHSIKTIEYAVVENKIDRDILEILLISKYKPKYNKQLQYKSDPTIVIDSTIMLFWQKEPNILQYRFYERENKIHKVSKNPSGRPRISLPKEFYELYPKWKEKKITAVSFMEQIGISKSTFYRSIIEYQNTLQR